MKLFNSSVGRLVPSLVPSFIEAILFFCEGKTKGTRICGNHVAKMEWLRRTSGLTASVA